MDEQNPTYEDVNNRLKEIVEAVADDQIDLDNALDLFEEAVALGMQASSMMEEDLAARDAQAEEREMQQQQAEELAEQEFSAQAATADAAPPEGTGAAEAQEIADAPASDGSEEPVAPAFGQAPALESEDALD